jgi:hypothetical protein
MTNRPRPVRVRRRAVPGSARPRARPPYAVSGYALPLALLACIALGFIAAGAAIRSLSGSRIAVNFDAFHRALDVAEGGLDQGIDLLASAYESGAPLTDSLGLVENDTLSGFTYTVRAEFRRDRALRPLLGLFCRHRLRRSGRRGRARAADDFGRHRTDRRRGAPFGGRLGA